MAVLRLKVNYTTIKAQKIDSFSFKIYTIIVVSFEILEKLDKA